MSDTGVLYLDVSINTNEQPIDVSIEGSSESRLPYYDGPYVVEPKKGDQELETKNKSMRDNVTVKSIYFSETTNVGGGYTVVIGKEIEEENNNG